MLPKFRWIGGDDFASTCDNGWIGRGNPLLRLAVGLAVLEVSLPILSPICIPKAYDPFEVTIYSTAFEPLATVDVIANAKTVAVNDFGRTGFSRWFPTGTGNHFTILHHEVVLLLTVLVPPVPRTVLFAILIVDQIIDLPVGVHLL